MRRKLGNKEKEIEDKEMRKMPILLSLHLFSSPL